jgi:gamma-aminobutyric acid type B receptor
MSIPELNDSRWIGMCIYNVIVMGGVGAILVLGTRQDNDVLYILSSVIVIVGTTVTQILIFVPKVGGVRGCWVGGFLARLYCCC